MHPDRSVENSKMNPNESSQSTAEPSNPLSRKEFLGMAAAAGLGLAASGCGPIRTVQNTLRRLSGSFDVILREGTIVDGTGESAYVADIGILDDEIAAIGNLASATAGTVFNCSGFHVFPGFVDIHSHSDYVLFEDRRAFSKIFQGVTTEIVGQDGRSPGPYTVEFANSMHAYLKGRYPVPRIQRISEYYDALEDLGITVNIKTMIGAGILRQGQAGYKRRKLDRSEMQEVRALVRQGLSDGACGISSGLEYLPNAYSDTEEMISLCRGAGLYSTHMRNEDDRVLEALVEAIRIAERAGVALNVSHFKLQGQRNWDKVDTAFEIIRNARKGGIRISMDRYPYTAYHTSLNSLFPVWAQKKGIKPALAHGRDGDVLRKQVEAKISGIGGYDRIRLGVVYSQKYKKYSGKNLQDIARSTARSPYELMFDIAATGSASTVVFAMSEENLIRIYSDPDAMVASDGSALSPGMKGNPHPRNYGTFSHFLEYFVLKKKIMPLEEAIRKCTGLPASVVGLQDRGLIRTGWKADLAVFNLKKVHAYATYDNPIRFSRGVEALLINGRFVIRNARFQGNYPGKPLREPIV